jgi:Tfp pilus assembly protein PilN
MYNELTNLLPPERQRALSRNYFLRLGVVSAVLLCILTLASAALLLPTYVFLAESTSAKEARLANIESALSSANEKELSVRLAALSGDAATLTALASAPSASTMIRTVLAVSRPGIALSGFAYTPVANKVPGTLTISGIAATRDTLRNYQLTLQRVSFARSATLPVSAYAEDTDIAFTITVTLAP